MMWDSMHSSGLAPKGKDFHLSFPNGDFYHGTMGMGFPIPRGQMTVYQKLISLKLFLTNGHILSIYSATRSLPTLAPLVDATLTSNQLAGQQWKRANGWWQSFMCQYMKATICSVRCHPSIVNCNPASCFFLEQSLSISLDVRSLNHRMHLTRC